MKEDKIFNIADKIARDLLNGKGLPFEDKWSKTSFGKLIEVQRHEISVISSAYEDEIRDLNVAISGLTDKMAQINAEKEELQDKILRLEDDNQILLKLIIKFF